MHAEVLMLVIVRLNFLFPWLERTWAVYGAAGILKRATGKQKGNQLAQLLMHHDFISIALKEETSFNPLFPGRLKNESP